jgi:hypothetical protein
MMRRQYVLTIAVAVVMGSGVNVLAEDRLDAREQLATAVPEAIRLLENKKYEDFVTSFIAPDDLKKITKEQSTEEFARQFGKGKAVRALQILKAIEGKTPKLDHDGTTATFTHDVKDAPRDTITFVKVGKYWHIQN